MSFNFEELPIVFNRGATKRQNNHIRYWDSYIIVQFFIQDCCKNLYGFIFANDPLTHTVQVLFKRL